MNNPISFCSTITNTEAMQGTRFWSFCEWYCPTLGKSFKVTRVDITEKRAFVEADSTHPKDGWIVTLACVISYCTLILPLLAFALRAYYRHQFSFFLETLPPISVKTIEELWEEIGNIETEWEESSNDFYIALNPSPLISQEEFKEAAGFAPLRLISHMTKSKTETLIDERIKKCIHMSTLVLEAAYKEANGDPKTMANLLQEQVRGKKKDYCFRFQRVNCFYFSIRGCHYSLAGGGAHVPVVPKDYQARFFAEGTPQSAWRESYNKFVQLLDTYGVREHLTDRRFMLDPDHKEPADGIVTFTAK